MHQHVIQNQNAIVLRCDCQAKKPFYFRCVTPVGDFETCRIHAAGEENRVEIGFRLKPFDEIPQLAPQNLFASDRGPAILACKRVPIRADRNDEILFVQ